ncbi:transposable element Tcb1 transposase [Trichonephila clavipes]|nr:transposable element Tcb1 transposase [Trichonephila clavipes]
MTGHIYRDVILEQHVRLFRGAMGAELMFMDDNAHPHRANIVECLQSEDITRMDWLAYSPDLNPIEHVRDMLGRRISARQPLPPDYRNFGGHCLISGVIFPKIRLIIRYSACLSVRILFSDEAHFWLNGYVNKQNCRIWSEANPQVYVETPLHPEKLTVWCALWAGGILLQKR